MKTTKANDDMDYSTEEWSWACRCGCQAFEIVKSNDKPLFFVCMVCDNTITLDELLNDRAEAYYH